MYQTEKEKNDNVEMIDILMRHEVKLWKKANTVNSFLMRAYVCIRMSDC